MGKQLSVVLPAAGEVIAIKEFNLRLNLIHHQPDVSINSHLVSVTLSV